MGEPRRLLRLLAPSRRRRALAGAALVCAVVIALVVILDGGIWGRAAGASQPRKISGASTVERRDLVSTDTESGTLSYASPETVFNRMSGTITSLPTVGQVIRAGGTLYTVDGTPVILMNGTIPAYRSLASSVSAGADVRELKQNLRALGFDPDHQLTNDGTFDAATTDAVKRWQASLGESLTGTVSLGRVVFLPGPRRVTTVSAALGSTGGGSGSGSASGSGTGTTASARPAPSQPEFVSLTSATPRPASTTTTTSTTTTSSRRTTTAPGSSGAAGAKPGSSTGRSPSSSTLAALVALLQAEIAELKTEVRSGTSSTPSAASRSGSATRKSTGTASSSSGTASSSRGGASASSARSGGSSNTTAGGGGTASAQPILQTTSTSLVVTVDLDATKQSEAVRGAGVTVQMPDGSTVDGTITSVSPVAQTSSNSTSSSASGGGGAGSGSSSPSTVPVTITLKGHRHTAGLDQAAVSVNFEQQKARHVLSVPVTALLATAGGGYAVQEAAAPQKLIPVTPGLFAAGYVEIAGAGIYPGLQVTDSQG